MRILDTRDLDKKLDDMESELEDLREALSDAEEKFTDLGEEDLVNELTSVYADWQDWLEENFTPLSKLEEINAELHEKLSDAAQDLSDWLDENEEELKELQNMRDEIPEWRHGEALIPEDDFEEYAQQLADDLYDIDQCRWPFDCIDWKQAADALRMDYSSIEYQGETYLYRS